MRKFILSLSFLIICQSAFGASLAHDYGFAGTLADSLGGPSLIANGGTVNATDYSFAAGQGLSLTNALTKPPSIRSISISSSPRLVAIARLSIF